MQRQRGDLVPIGEVIGGLLVGAAMAVLVCGLLAVLINIRDLLAESLEQRPSRDGLADSLEGR